MKGGYRMAKQITELSDELKLDFNIKCAELDIKQRVAVIKLISLWVNDKIKIPGE